jgi:hypothetical protein
MHAVMNRLEDLPKPALIALVVIGFIVFWPIGLALLVYSIWSGRMFCGRNGHSGRWYTPEDRDAARQEWRARREEWRSWKRQHWSRRNSSGNVAFDEYREETLRKLDEEQREFRDYLDRLRSAKDRAEFDQFMAERRSRPPSTEPSPPPAPTAGY